MLHISTSRLFLSKLSCSSPRPRSPWPICTLSIHRAQDGFQISPSQHKAAVSLSWRCRTASDKIKRRRELEQRTCFIEKEIQEQHILPHHGNRVIFCTRTAFSPTPEIHLLTVPRASAVTTRSKGQRQRTSVMPTRYTTRTDDLLSFLGGQKDRQPPGEQQNSSTAGWVSGYGACLGSDPVPRGSAGRLQ